MNVSNEVLITWSLGKICNLACVYCVTKNKNKFENNSNVARAENDGLSPAPNALDYALDLTTQNIKSAVNSLEKLNKVCKISFTGGEPTLVSNFIELCQALTKKHYIRLDTNNCTLQMEEFGKKISPDKVFDLNPAFHIAEIEKRDLLKIFLSNIMSLKKRGFPVTYTTIVAYPGIFNKISFYKSILSEYVVVSIVPFCGYYNGKYYPAAYTERELEELKIDRESLAVLKTKNKYCIAGTNYFLIEYGGRVVPCNSIYTTLGNILYGFGALPEPIKCPFDICLCNPKVIDPGFFKTALGRVTEANDS